MAWLIFLMEFAVVDLKISSNRKGFLYGSMPFSCDIIKDCWFISLCSIILFPTIATMPSNFPWEKEKLKTKKNRKTYKCKFLIPR